MFSQVTDIEKPKNFTLKGTSQILNKENER